jgi:hypothetical protein
MRARRELARAATLRRCTDLIAASADRLAQASIGIAAADTGAAMLRHELRRLYRKSRKAYAQAADSPTNDTLHEWRKQTKYLHAAATVVRSPGSGYLPKLLKRTKKIAARLGDDHDLAMLRDELRHSGSKHVGARHGEHRQIAELRVCGEQRRAILQRKALAAGAKAFAKKPKRFIAQLS